MKLEDEIDGYFDNLAEDGHILTVIQIYIIFICFDDNFATSVSLNGAIFSACVELSKTQEQTQRNSMEDIHLAA